MRDNSMSGEERQGWSRISDARKYWRAWRADLGKWVMGNSD